MKQKTMTFIIAAGLLVLIGVGIAIMMISDSQPVTFTIEDETLKIDAAFGVSVPIPEIKDIELVQSLPIITRKTNGLGLGSIYKGEFLLEGDVKARLYLDESLPPFIRFIYDDTVFYVNGASKEATQALYEQIEAAAL